MLHCTDRSRKQGDRLRTSTMSSNVGLLSFFLAAITTVTAQDFGYDGQKGPTHWGEQYNTCFGKYQSPIDINSLMVKRAQLPPLEFHPVQLLPNQTTIKNNGHTVMVSVDSDTRPTITGGPLSGTYEFAQLHFHWGENDTMGSEDLIDGQSFPMELHVVFYKKQYRNVRSAMEKADGLTVLAFFFHLDDEINPKYIELTELLSNISDPDTSLEFDRMTSIEDLILPELNEYYTYHGSLTTPPCSEVVTWIDFKQSIPLSHTQIEVFRTIRDEEGHQLTHNFRPIQPLGDRDVYFITSSYDGILENDQTHLVEPSQDLDSKLTNTPAKQKQLTEDTDATINDNIDNDIDSAIQADQAHNDVEAETSTVHHRRKFGKLGSDANSISLVNGLLVTTSVILWMTRQQ